jgi:hypothetical protein
MSKPIQSRFLVSKQSASIGLTQAAPLVFSDGLPTGDEAIYALHCRLRGALDLTTSSAGSAVTNGVEVFVRNIRIESDKHGILVDNMDGLAMYRYNQIDKGTLPDDLNVTTMTTGTPALDYTFEIPFADKNFLRSYDTLLDMLKSKLTIYVTLGIVTDMVSGGTYTGTFVVTTPTVEVWGDIIRNPNPLTGVVDGVQFTSELPIMQRSIEVRKFDINQTSTGVKLALPYGDRIYRRIILQQRNGSTLAELATVITATQNIGIEINGFPWIQAIPWAAVNARNKQDFQMETLPTGIAVFDWGQEGRIGDMLNTLSNDQGTMNLVADVTSVSNGQIWAILDCLKPIPPQARRNG